MKERHAHAALVLFTYGGLPLLFLGAVLFLDNRAQGAGKGSSLPCRGQGNTEVAWSP